MIMLSIFFYMEEEEDALILSLRNLKQMGPALSARAKPEADFSGPAPNLFKKTEKVTMSI